VKLAKGNGFPESKNSKLLVFNYFCADISSDRTVKDINASSYFIDYSPMALVLNNDHEDFYGQERIRTYESLTGGSFTFN
jgi:hypothetical protein